MGIAHRRRRMALSSRMTRLRPVQVGLIAVLLAATATSAALILRTEADQIRDAEQGWAQRASDEMRDAIETASRFPIGLQGLYDVLDGTMAPQAFARDAAVALRDPDLLGLSWAPRVGAGQRARFERANRLRILQIKPGGDMGVAAPSSVYFPFLELAWAGGAVGVPRGLDASSAIPGFSKLLAAVDAGAPVVPWPPVPVGPDGFAIALAAPIYAPGAPTSNAAERRAALRGFAGAAYRPALLARTTTRLLPTGTRLQIAVGGQVVLGPVAAVNGAERTIVTAGLPWTVRVDTDVQLALATPLIVLSAGIVFAALLGLLFAQSNRRERMSRRRASEQAALRRVATAVAAGSEPTGLLDLVAHEAAALLGTRHACVIRFGAEDGVIVGASSQHPGAGLLRAVSLPLHGDGALGQIMRTGRPGRIDDYAAIADNPAARLASSLGWRGGVAAPIRVGGLLWGAVLVASRDAAPLAADAEARLAEFAGLVGMGIAETETREGLRASQDELRRQAGIVRAVLDAAPEAISMVDLEGRAMIANPAAERLLRELVGARADGAPPDGFEALAGLTTDPDGMRAALRALDADPERTGEQEYELADSGRIFRTYSAPVRAGTDRPTILGRIFVTAEVTDERRLARAKDEFTQLASHELRTPLTSIMGYLEIVLEGEAGELRPEQRRFLEVVERNTGRLLSLVADLLVVARADAGRLGLELCALDLGELAAECAESAGPVAGERRIALEVDVEPLPLSGDRGRLCEVIDNLISNALKFTPPDGRVRLSARLEHGWAVLEVTDSGMGIAAADQEHLFERFYRTEAALQAAIPGSGLGLAISRMIVEAHGGIIGVESVEGRGATFRVELPLPASAGGGANGRVGAEGLAGRA
jgi:signal transduction histidine kinase